MEVCEGGMPASGLKELRNAETMRERCRLIEEPGGSFYKDPSQVIVLNWQTCCDSERVSSPTEKQEKRSMWRGPQLNPIYSMISIISEPSSPKYAALHSSYRLAMVLNTWFTTNR